MTFTFKNAAVTFNSLNGNLGGVQWVANGKAVDTIYGFRHCKLDVDGY